MEIIFDEYDMRKLPPRERLDKIMTNFKKRNRRIYYDGILFGLQEK